MKRYVVTGCAGFIGSHTVEALLRQGHVVLGLDNFRTGREENLSVARQCDRFEFASIDITERARLLESLSSFRPDALIHLAAMVSVPESFEKPELNQRLNVDATQWVAEAAQACGVKRLVFASSAAVYGNCDQLPLKEDAPVKPLSPYGSAKLASERILMELAARTSLACHCLRYFNVYGPRQDPSSPYSGVITRFVSRINLADRLTIFGDGEQSRDFIHVRDVSLANALAADDASPNSAILNICTGQGTSLNHLAAVLQQSLGQSAGIDYEPARSGDVLHSCGAPSRAKACLGFSATQRLEKALREIVSSSKIIQS